MDSIPLPSWYMEYVSEGVSKIDSDFEADASDMEEIEFFKLFDLGAVAS